MITGAIKKCVSCTKGKMTKKPFPKASSSRSTSLFLDLIHERNSRKKEILAITSEAVGTQLRLGTLRHLMGLLPSC